MEKKRTKLRYVLILTVFFIIQFLIVTRFGQYLYGSTIDWDSQHYRIPEYFRSLFYSTGDLFPDFAPNLGAGQNIYNLSYYGLFNPVIMLSYLLPFVSMRSYIIASTVILIYISVLLLYRWLLGHFTEKSSAITAMLFILASPLLFHTHRHIMFINYMPFLILALMGVDEYFDKGKKWIIAISVCLICLMSYFFSIGAIFAIVIYGIYVYIRKNEKITVKGFFADGIKFVLPIALGVLMAAFLLVPTFIALISGRAEGASVVDIPSLFIPKFNQDYILYSTYSLGLTSISLFSLFYCVLKLKRENRFLGIVLSLFIIFPIFVYILNGTMYVNSKVLIPFLPVYMLAVASCIRDMFFRKKADWTCLIVFSVFTLLLILDSLINGTQVLTYVGMLEFIITIASLVVFNLVRKRRFLVVSASVISLISFFSAQMSDTLVVAQTVSTERASDSLIEYALENDKSIYRINDRTGGLDIANRSIDSRHYLTSIYSSLSSQIYADFYYDGIGNEIRNRSRGQLSNPFNIVFDLYMGNKYTVKKDLDMLGYKKVTTAENGISLYKTDDALPIAYSTDRVMPLSQFEKLTYPYNAEALLNYVIVEDAPECAYETSITPLTSLEYKITKQDGVEIKNENDIITLTSKENGKLTLKLNPEIKNKLIFIEFTMNSNNKKSVGDNHMSINDNVNKLPYKNWKYHNRNYTFEYTLSNGVTDEIEIVMKKGTYAIKDLKIYTADYAKFVSKTKDVSALEFDTGATRGDVIEGKITAKADGYFNISVPYDKSFKIYVDGVETDYEMTDTAFIGFKMNAGEHNVRIVYTAPFANISKIVSFCAWFAFAVLFCLEYKRHKQPRGESK